MTWKQVFTSSIGKKFVMALTGISLVAFLVVHMGINACIFAMDGGDMFNKAAHFMGGTVVIRIAEIGLFIGIFAHIIQGIILWYQNAQKRDVQYAVSMGNKGSKWYSRSMGLLGTILLLFFILHWYHFWIPSRFSTPVLGQTTVDGVEMHDMFTLMKITFEPLWVVLVYVFACISLAYHLLHGFQSSFRTLGVGNKKWLALVKTTGVGFSIIVPLIFALMPVAMHFGWVS